MEIEENVPLAPLTTFRIGGPARYFAQVTAHRQIAELVTFAKEKRLPLFILGGGSNLLVNDQGFPGLVISIAIKGISMKPVVGGAVSVTVGAGESWDAFVATTVEKGFFGLENLSGIPGTVGASPVQNIGAYGAEVKDTISHVEVYDMRTGETKIIAGHDCGFGYRESIFKKKENKELIITRVTYVLRTDGILKTTYVDLVEYAKRNHVEYENPADIRKAVLAIRGAKLPDVTEVGTAGSFFKNPVVSVLEYEKIKITYPLLPGFPTKDGKIKIPLGFVLDKICHLRGWREGAVGAYTNQALVLVNYGGATAVDIIRAVEKITALVKEKTSLVIEPEVQYLTIV